MKQAQAQGFAVYDMAGVPAAALRMRVPATATSSNPHSIPQACRWFPPTFWPCASPSHEILFGLRQRLRGLPKHWRGA